jgi:hypothetical protein
MAVNQYFASYGFVVLVAFVCVLIDADDVPLVSSGFCRVTKPTACTSLCHENLRLPEAEVTQVVVLGMIVDFECLRDLPKVKVRLEKNRNLSNNFSTHFSRQVKRHICTQLVIYI